MDPDVQIVLTQGWPIAIATVLYAAIRLYRAAWTQALLPDKLKWANWPKPICLLVVFLAATLGALVPALMAHTPFSSALVIAVTAGLSAMGIDAGHGAIKLPDSSAKVYAAAGLAIDGSKLAPSLATPANPLAPSIATPMPEAKTPANP